MHTNLTTRVLWAVMLGVLAVAMTLWGRWPFAAMLVVGGCTVLWEWARLVCGGRIPQIVPILMISVAGAVVAMTADRLLLAAGSLLAGIVLTLVLGQAQDRPRWLALAIVCTGAPGLALVWLRADPALGVMAIFFLFAVVWTADSAAYISGRLIGGPKLNPRLSPRKTWAGLIGGSIVPMAPAAAFAFALPGASALALAALGLLLALTAHSGDLAESALKRRFGAKDSSALIPGHGGLLDRIDGFLAAALMAGLIALLHNPAHPGRALLSWP